MFKKTVKKPAVLTLLPKPTGYSFPRKWLEQPYFVTPEKPAGLGLSMLTNEKFSSPLGHLLVQLSNEGHDVSACLAEYQAMRELLHDIDKSMESLAMDITRLRFRATRPGLEYVK